MAVVIPRQLYTAEDLLGGFNPWDPMGYALSHDFSIYREFVANGGPLPTSLDVMKAQAEHDAAIADALRIFLKTVQRPLVGIMGGHSVPRNVQAYKDIAYLARDLAREEFLLVTGGGPGIMEAAHLGVAFSSFETTKQLDAAIALLGKAPDAPVLDDLFAEDGTIQDKKKLEALVQAREWLKVALEVRAMAPSIMPVSLAIPTWLYGAEPTVPFATHYAKYFHNSLREEALVNNSRAGIVYGRGGGGTMREVYQDVERNYYAKTLEQVTPMIFFDGDRYWQTDPELDGKELKKTINTERAVQPILAAGLVNKDRSKATVDACLDEKLLFTTDHAKIILALRAHEEVSQRNLAYALASEPLKIGTLRMNRA